MTSARTNLPTDSYVWHPGDRIRLGDRTWHFVTYMKGLEQWVRPELPDLWVIAPPVGIPLTAFDHARKAGPDKTHKETMYRLLADMGCDLVRTANGWTCEGPPFPTAAAAIYHRWINQ